MVFGKQRYYLTMFGPHRGERVVASVDTEDRYNAEKLFGCGSVDEQGFGFRGLYTEEEVLHMFRPGTDIAGTYNPMLGSCDKHRDYRKVSTFEVVDTRVYRSKASERWLLELDGKNTDFTYVKDVMSGKIAPISVDQENQHTANTQNEVHQQIQNDDSLSKTVSFFDAIDDADEPEFDDTSELFGEDVEVLDSKDEVSNANQNLTDVYSNINTVRTTSKAADDTDYISDFDANFDAAQDAVSKEDDFRKKMQQTANDGSLKTGEPLKKQGQSLHDIMLHGFGAEEFHM